MSLSPARLEEKVISGLGAAFAASAAPRAIEIAPTMMIEVLR
jgi:hypothetical protein